MIGKEKGPAYPNPKQAWTTVGILSFTYMFSFIDRQILVLLVEPMKADLNITDTQVSLLTGFAFAIVYTLAGIPMGRAADGWVRKYVIIMGVAVWSLLTITCGFARNFFHLFIARMGVGLGEAALTPTAYAMMPDLFPPNELAKGMSIFALGGSMGAGISLLFGGAVISFATELGSISLPFVGEMRTWQIVLIAVGGVSLLMIIPLSLMPEPKRQGVTAQINNMDFNAVLRYLVKHASFYGYFFSGIALYALFIYGLLFWLPSYFIRVHHWGAAETGITLGVLMIVPSTIGTLSAGWLSDYFYGKGYRGAPLYMAITALVLSIPMLLVLIYVPQMEVRLAALILLSFTLTVLAVIPPTVTQMATPARIRGQVSAIYLLIVNLVGIGCGPTVMALVTDNIFHDELAVGHSIALVGVVTCGLGAGLLWSAVKPFKHQLERAAHGSRGEQQLSHTKASPLAGPDTLTILKAKS